MKKLILIFLIACGLAVGVSAEEAKAEETKKANVFGSKAKNGWLKDFEYNDDWCWYKGESAKFLVENKITRKEADKQCREYLKEEIRLLIPYAEKKDGKKCNIDMDNERGSGKSDEIYCGRLKNVLKTLYGNHWFEGMKIVDIEYKLLQ